mgnify:CR=1 FL=1
MTPDEARQKAPEMIRLLRRTPLYEGSGEGADNLIDEATAVFEALQAENADLKKQLADHHMFHGNRHPEIEIETLREAGSDGGGFMGYFCRGHADPEAFAWAANYHGDHLSGYDYDWRFVRARDVKHVWWRTVPIGGDAGEMQFVPATGPGKGAWAATVADGSMSRYWRDQARRIKDRDQGRLQGIQEGLLWCVSIFRWSGGTKEEIEANRAIAERIETAWKSHGDETLRRERERESA